MAAIPKLEGAGLRSSEAMIQSVDYYSVALGESSPQFCFFKLITQVLLGFSDKIGFSASDSSRKSIFLG